MSMQKLSILLKHMRGQHPQSRHAGSRSSASAKVEDAKNDFLKYSKKLGRADMVSFKPAKDGRLRIMDGSKATSLFIDPSGKIGNVKKGKFIERLQVQSDGSPKWVNS